MDIFGTKTTKNQILRIKLLPKIIFWIFLPLFDHFLRFSKFKILGFFCTFWPISKQTADFSKKGFYNDDRLLMLYVLASIVFLYHQWLRWDFEMLDWLLHQPGVPFNAVRILKLQERNLSDRNEKIFPRYFTPKSPGTHNGTEK